MPSTTDKPTATTRASAGLLTTLRDVLFEATPSSAVKVSGPPSPPPISASADVDAARTALRQGLEAALGPGLRELLLQLEALREVLPDAKQRLRAALRVLSLKGVAPAALVAELEQVLGELAEQNTVFSSKLAARRASIEAEQGQAEATCRDQTADAQQSIVRLEGELAAARAELTAASAQREQALAACEESRRRLTQKQLGFEHAYSELCGEYTTLQQQLSNPQAV
jgi:chromosome segregation ATPase